jgi:hypothetical protein
VPLRHLDPKLPRDLEIVCSRAIGKSPSHRYPTAAAFAEDLRRFLAGWPVKARAVGKLVRLTRWLRRKLLFPLVILALQAVLIALVIGATALWMRTAGINPAAPRVEPPRQEQESPVQSKSTELPKAAPPSPRASPQQGSVKRR